MTTAALLDTVTVTDALELLRACDSGSVDAIITDLPYGTTACAWDTIIPFPALWDAVRHALKPRGVFVTTANQPFTSALVMSNPVWFKYSWIWVKNKVTGFVNAHKQPLRKYEDILVFGGNTYHPQGLTKITATRRNGISTGGSSVRGGLTMNAGAGKLRTVGAEYVQEFTGYPDNVLFFDCEPDTEHGTQKPVALYEYLIRTYTRPGDTVVDPTCGSGTTAIAARNTNRHYIAGDLSPEYVAIAQRRLAQPYTLPMFD